ncbi:MAG: putative porin, partial [Vicinamibacteria bacterium]|nr:putative porin [Vicinamibacteria bacterium]
SSFPLKFTASLTFRQDFTDINDENDLLAGDDRIDGLRTRIRFGVESAKSDSIVGGGLRFSTGEAPNPASPFVRFGDALRPSVFNLDRFFLTVKPFKDRDKLVFTAGKMPLPLYRPGAGTWRDELLWDDDVSPSGVALQARFLKRGSDEKPVRLDNNLVYFVFEDITNARFSGITGTAYMAGDQLKLTIPHLEASGGYFHYTNLNVGLRSPNFTPGEGAFVLPGTSPFLLRSGLQHSNNSVNYGPGADGFVKDDFEIWNAAATLRFNVLGNRLGKPEMFLAGDYSNNSSVTLDERGYSVSIGFVGGGWSGGAHPYTFHGTWRDVDADAVLATFADSDLGAGSSYKGFEVGGNYRVSKNLLGLFQYFNFKGFPRKDERVHRLFLDLIWDF